jgi:hypothetical protein
VPSGASFSQVTDTLSAARHHPGGPRLQGVRPHPRCHVSVKPGTYAFRPGTAWSEILDDLTGGRVLTARW